MFLILQEGEVVIDFFFINGNIKVREKRQLLRTKVKEADSSK